MWTLHRALSGYAFNGTRKSRATGGRAAAGLFLPKDPAKLSDFLDYTDTLSYAAKATNGCVEVHHGILSGDIPPTNIRLRVGQVLMVRLGPSHSVVPKATLAPVRQEGSREDPGGWVVLTFRAVAPGSADLVRIDPVTDKQPESRVVIAGIRVESPKPATP